MNNKPFPEFEDGQLREFLTHEISRQEERNQRATVLSVMVIVLITVYMSFICYSVSTNLFNPKSVAQWLSYVAHENLPSVLDNTQHEPKQQAPAMADQLMTGVVLEMPAFFGERAREQIDFVIDEQLPYVRDALNEMMSTFLAENLKASKDLLRAQNEPGFAKVFIDQLVADMASGLDAELQRDGGHGLSDVMSISLAALETINQQLERLEADDTAGLTYEDELQRKLILSCLQIMEELLAQAEDDGQPLFSTGTFESF